jgi:hypothetical protein
MKKALALTALLAAAAFGTANAKDMDSATSKADSVAIVYAGLAANNGDHHLPYHGTPASKAEAQNEIRTNDPLRDTLKDEHIQLSNVIGIGIAGDGSKTVYVR